MLALAASLWLTAGQPSYTCAQVRWAIENLDGYRLAAILQSISEDDLNHFRRCLLKPAQSGDDSPQPGYGAPQ